MKGNESNQTQTSTKKEQSQASKGIELASISLPKGGGAIKGIDEKFRVNSTTGSSAISIPLPLTAGRNGFTPGLGLSYDSGAGTGIFGMGWQMASSSIQIKTGKSLPKYSDQDIYVFSEAEDIVPYLKKDTTGKWDPVITEIDGFKVSRYRPRIESSHTKIEKIEHSDFGVYWKVTSRNNITTFFGRNEAARISDPNNAKHIFKWFAEFSFDDKGNWIHYQYKEEDLENVPNTISEKHRINQISKITNRYLKRVKYGNLKAYFSAPTNVYDFENPSEVFGSEDEKHCFELVMDYGEHAQEAPTPNEEIDQKWSYRLDAFSSYRSGYEIRTNRLCQRVLMFHKFTELGEEPCLVKSLELIYEPSNINNSGQSETTYLSRATQSGFIRKADQSYSKKSMPSMVFEYQNLEWDTTVQEVSKEALKNIPVGLTNNYQWVDLYGEGISGILTEQTQGWYYNENLGNIEGAGSSFQHMHEVLSKPSIMGLNNGTVALQDLEANGEKQLVINSRNIKGFHEIQTNETKSIEFSPFRPFLNIANVDWRSPNTRFLDLNGDGRPDLVVSEDNAFVWYENLGKEGYGPRKKVIKSFDEELGPSIVFSDALERIYLADFSGDGLTDIVRIRNGEVCYWPNLGYGRFGAKVVMNNAPIFDHPESFNSDYLHLADISGTGTADLIYLGKNKFTTFINLSGNAWSNPHEIEPFFAVNNSGKLSVVDLLGTGTSCIVWSSDLPDQHPMKYIDLMGSTKPHILKGYSNSMGKEVSLSYQNSTYYYLKDKMEGTPWITKLPFPLSVISQTVVKDLISSSSLSTSYRYHHGYYDYEEREFRGFGRVDQIDQESFETYKEEDILDMPPVLTKTWVHTGSYKNQAKFSRQYRHEYFQDDVVSNEFPDSVIIDALSFSYVELREAVRSLKGAALRKEVYTLDGTEQEAVPYVITETNFTVKQLQPILDSAFGVYQALGRETLTYSSERNTNDSRISHQFELAHDEYGHTLESIQIAYPRRSGASNIHPEQLKLYAILGDASFENETQDYFRLGLPLGQSSYEIKGLQLGIDLLFSFEDIQSQLVHVTDPTNILDHHEEFTTGVQARLVGKTNNFYKQEALKSLALLDYTEQLVMTQQWSDASFDGKVEDLFLEEAGYVKKEAAWWIQSDRPTYLTGDHFYHPHQNEDAFGNISSISFDDYNLNALSATDALGNTIYSEIDYRTLSVKKVIDINDSVTESITDELGMVIATTVYGTEENETKGDAPINHYVPQQSPSVSDILENPMSYLQQTSLFFYYHLEPWEFGNLPPHFVQLQRVTHVSELAPNQLTEVQISLGYSDGFGRTLQSKVKHSENQWLVSGRTVFNNKEKPVKQYEPFFSDTYTYQTEEEIGPVGITPILYYDALGRLVKTETPDGFHSKIEFDPWQVTTYDQNDTVLDSKNYVENATLPATDPKKMTLEKAAPHYNTPSTVVLDSLGREFRVEQLKEEGGIPLVTYTEFDIQGNPLSQTDPRQYVENQNRSALDRVNNFKYHYDLVGNVLCAISQDAGTSYNLINVKGNPLYAWSARDYRTKVSYDPLHRPRETRVEGPDLNIVSQKINYGKDRTKNQNGQAITSYDPSGKLENLKFSFKGLLLSSTKQLCSQYKTEVNWEDEHTVLMEPEIFSTQIQYDGLDRILENLLPDGSIHRPNYHPIGWLKGIEAQLRSTEFGAKSTELPTVFVEHIDYDAKGQRTYISYGNGVSTQYSYDQYTFQLTNLVTRRQESNGSHKTLQDIGYVYDPIGNIILIVDNSHDHVFHAGQQVDPTTMYVYDAMYQLKQATGREHLALQKNSHQQHASIFKDTQFTQVNNTGQLSNYTRNYTYDDSGNLTQLQHIGVNAFTRNLTPSGTSNQSISDESNSGIGASEHFDDAGNLLQLEHLAAISWDYRNNLVSATIIERQIENENGLPITTNDAEYYVYDASGQRIRKVKETYNSSGDLLWIDEKIYIGGIEIKRKYQGNSKVLRENRSTAHIADNLNRIALAHHWELSNDSSVTLNHSKIQFQCGNHLGSASLELDNQGMLISYEEYFPFGSTSFTTGASLAEVKLKEYRYSGKERDDTTGLYYYGARYYASWLGRWLNPDPAGTIDGLNLYRYVRNNPIKYIDETGNYPGQFQKKFNKDIAELIVASGNQKVIDRLLVKTDKGYKLNTNYHTGFNAGHTVSGDRVSIYQELGVELARTNQPDGWMERRNRGMAKFSVEVDIGKGIKIPVEAFTARELELNNILPAGTSDLPAATGWTQSELDQQIEAKRTGRTSPPTDARVRWSGSPLPEISNSPRASSFTPGMDVIEGGADILTPGDTITDGLSNIETHGRVRTFANSVRRFIPSKYDDAVIGGLIGLGVGLYSRDANAGMLAGASVIAPETVQNTSGRAVPVRMGRDAASYHPVIAIYETGSFVISGTYNLGGWMQSNGYGLFPHTEQQTREELWEEIRQDMAQRK